jgi:hypothetical protein
MQATIAPMSRGRTLLDRAPCTIERSIERTRIEGRTFIRTAPRGTPLGPTMQTCDQSRSVTFDGIASGDR